MKTHTVPIMTNGPLCGEACPWLYLNGAYRTECVLFRVTVATRTAGHGNFEAYRCFHCRHVTDRAETLP